MKETESIASESSNRGKGGCSPRSERTGCDEEASDEERLRRIELVRKNAGVTFEDARAALKLTGYDVLDAVVLLEREGKTAPAAVHFSTGRPSCSGASQTGSAEQMTQAQIDYENDTRRVTFEEKLGVVMQWIKHALQRSIDITLIAKRHGRQVFSMPLLLVIFLFMFSFWTVLPLQVIIIALIVSLFFDFRYHLEDLSSSSTPNDDASGSDADEADRGRREG